MEFLTAEQMRNNILNSLSNQGYLIKDGMIILPDGLTKDDYRNLHKLSVEKKIENAERIMKPFEDRLLKYIANGKDIDPKNIKPKLVLVERKTENELLFRYASLHWSIPISSGYGRRLRFLVFDDNNGKLIGLFGLGDPVIAMKDRDSWIAWSNKVKTNYLYHVMDAFVMGAVPPYSFLLCGKLVALLACSNEVRNIFKRKYKGKKSLIKGKCYNPDLALITTTSALGKSSVYNRIKLDGYTYWKSVGYTQGWGEFHFTNGVYDSICDYVKANCNPSEKHQSWGGGYRNKREVIKKCLNNIGLSSNLIHHGIKREIYVAHLGDNSLQYLRGEVNDFQEFDWPTNRLSELALNRWCLPRAERKKDYINFDSNQYRIWRI